MRFLFPVPNYIAVSVCLLVSFTHAGPSGFHNDAKEDPSRYSLARRAPGDGGIGNDIKWTGMTSQDGANDGRDIDGVWYIKRAVELYTRKHPDPSDRIGVFWGGGAMTQDDFDHIDEFIELTLGDKGKKFIDVFSYDELKNEGGVDAAKRDNKYWRGVNRASKALAMACSGGTAYVYMKPNGCRTLFSPPSQNPQDADPAHNGQATNGEIWYYAELPTLMRNLNINKIVTFYKTTRTPGNPPKFVQNVEWEEGKDANKPRTALTDVAMDAVPINLPAEAGRGPLKEKREAAPSSQISSLYYQAGLFDVLTTSFPDLITDSATVCTATSSLTTITTTVPVWSCQACLKPYNAIIVKPVSIAGSKGAVVSPPPGYPPLTIGPKKDVHTVSLPTATAVSVGDTSPNAYGATYRWPNPGASGSSASGINAPSDHSSGSHLSASSKQSGSASMTSISGPTTLSPSTVAERSSVSDSSGTGNSKSSNDSQRSSSGSQSGAATPVSSSGGGKPSSSRSYLSGDMPISSGSASGSSSQRSKSEDGSSASSSDGSSSGLKSEGGSAVSSSDGSRPSSSRPNVSGGISVSSSSGSRPSSPGSKSEDLNSASSSGGSRRSSSPIIGTAPFSITAQSSQSASNSGKAPSQSGKSSDAASASSLKGEPSSGQPTPPASSTKGGGEEPSTTAEPIGAETSSDAKDISTDITGVVPVWQNFIDNPTKDKGNDLIGKINTNILPPAKDFLNKVGPPPKGTEKDCTPSGNPITDIFNAAKCVVNTLTDTTKDIGKAIENNFKNMPDIKANFDFLKVLQKALDNPKDTEEQQEEEEEEEDDDEPSNSERQPSSTKASSRASSQTSSQPSSLASSASSSASSSSSSAAACPYKAGGSSIAADPAPQGPFTTVWFDYGVSCGGNNCDKYANPTAKSGDDDASKSVPKSGASASVTKFDASASLTKSAASASSTKSGASLTITKSGTSASSSPKSVATSSTETPDCMANGAPWMSPTSWCNCGPTARYSTISGKDDRDAMCAYTTLPKSPIVPMTTKAAPTNIPGQNGVPGCAAKVEEPGTSAFCNCGGTPAPTLKPTKDNFINCGYTIQPTSSYDPTIPTEEPEPEPEPPKKMTCNAHVREGLGTELGDPQVFLDVMIWEDGKPDISLGEAHETRDWSEALEVDSKVGKLTVTPESGLGDKKKHKRALLLGKRIGGPIPTPPLFQNGPVEFGYGEQKWDTESEKCSVGDWDNGDFGDFVDDFVFGMSHVPNRQMDCKFDCEMPS